MEKNNGVASLGRLALLFLASLAILCLPQSVRPAFAGLGKLAWTVIDTPSLDSVTNVIASPSEISVLAIGADDRTFYAADIPNKKIYRSTDGGIDWEEISGNLTKDLVLMPNCLSGTLSWLGMT